jgi:hypothetical protein
MASLGVSSSPDQAAAISQALNVEAYCSIIFYLYCAGKIHPSHHIGGQSGLASQHALHGLRRNDQLPEAAA